MSLVLHDAYEDTDITLEDIEDRFGKSVAFLVNGIASSNSLSSSELSAIC